jgi:signal transduction histidine kinase
LLRAMPVVASSGLATHSLIDALRQLAQGELAGAFEEVRWQVSPEAEAAACRLSPIAAEVAFGAAREAMRNAARHGRGGDQRRALRLLISGRVARGLELVIEDDGVGMATTGATDGSGQGIALHSTMLAVIGGTLTVEATLSRATRVTLALPLP